MRNVWLLSHWKEPQLHVGLPSMRHSERPALWPVVLALLSISMVWGYTSVAQPDSSFAGKLGTPVRSYKAGGSTFVQAVLNVAYDQRLPMALEYLDRDAVTKPLHLALDNTSIKGVLNALVAQMPEYHVTYSAGLVDIYCPKARNDPSNLLNTSIPDFMVRDADPMFASTQLWGALSVKLHPGEGYGGNFAPVGGRTKVTLHMQGAKVFQILNAIVAQHGDSIWMLRVPPSSLSAFQGDMWYLYSLDPYWRNVALSDAQSIFPSLK